MRKIRRIDLPEATRRDLERRQSEADAKDSRGELDAQAAWKSARQSHAIGAALAALREMAGRRERCMYCSDSHGTDIDHFRPKVRFPGWMFCWPNLLLCCSECGRFKGDRFPMDGGANLLVDPTAEDPWEFLDFDPATGNIVARFSVGRGDWDPRGSTTVEVLHLDRREALAASHQRAYRRLVSKVEAVLQMASGDVDAVVGELLEADDTGLLGWCLGGAGADDEPFASLRRERPRVWEGCVQRLARGTP